MGKTWVLDTETKGTGANMVPLDRTRKRAKPVEPVFVPRRPVSPREPETPQPPPPRRFRIIDVMTRQTLLDDGGAREAVGLLEGIRSIVDVDIQLWDDERERWQRLPLADQRALIDLAHDRQQAASA